MLVKSPEMSQLALNYHLKENIYYMYMTTGHRTLSEAVNNNIDNMARVALE